VASLGTFGARRMFQRLGFVAEALLADIVARLEAGA